MKKKLLAILILVLICTLLFIACAKEEDNENKPPKVDENTDIDISPSQPVATNKTCYIEYPVIEDENIVITMTDVRENIGRIAIDVTFLNNNPKPLFMKLGNETLYRERDGAEYHLKTDEKIEGISLECEIPTTIHFDGNLPTPIDDENFYFTVLNGKYKIHLYEMPDDMRSEVIIHRYVDGVKMDDVKTLMHKSVYDYDYVSEDKLNTCITWFSNEEMTKEISNSDIIMGESTIYGSSVPMFDYRVETVDTKKLVYIDEIKAVPTGGLMVIPNTLNGNTVVYVSLHNIRYMKSLTSIYIPKSVTDIYGDISMSKYIDTIYYEGTEEEWKTIYQGTMHDTTHVIYGASANSIA